MRATELETKQPTESLTHLHVHSHYTLLGATPTVPELVQSAAQQGMKALALTDTNVLYGAVAFAQACRAADIQPIVGMVVTVAAVEEVGARKWPRAAELVLLATGPAGWRSLCGLSSAIQARPDREEVALRGVDWETLRNFRSGLICLAGGRRSWLGRALHEGNAAAAARYASRLGGLYGEQAWLTLEMHRQEDVVAANVVVDIGKRFGLPVAAVQPVYCLRAEDRPRLRLLAAIAQNCPLTQVDGAHLPDEGDATALIHWQSPSELSQKFAAYPDALAGIGAIVSQCDPALPDGRPIWPVLALQADETPAQALEKVVNEGLAIHYPDIDPDIDPSIAHQQIGPSLRSRLAYELEAINARGFAPLFLLVADITAYARQQEIPYNTRGSVANSLVAYCCGITTVDPIAHDLLFERFLNPERAGLPDIDLDLCSHRRDEVLHYVRQRYGADKVALVATMATLRPKSAVRESAKAYGFDEATVEELSGKVRDRWHPDPRRREQDALEDLLAQISNASQVDASQVEMVKAAYDLVGVPHHLSIHPGGVVVAPEPIAEIAPVQWTPKGFHVTQFSHEDVEALGLPKIDLLGIRALTVLADAVKLVRSHHAPDFHLGAIPSEDAATAELLAQGATVGVFQCESSGAQRTLRQLRVKDVRDLAIANAFFKPGPATGGMAQAFIRRYRGEEEVSYLHPALAPILGPTQGVMLFQEQVLRVAHEIAGLSWTEADQLRKGMSKFRAHEMASLQAHFMEGCQRALPSGLAFSPTQAQTLWNQVMAFAGYGFNQGHATAYADVSYRSAYMKAHWPAEFLCARLADWGGFHHQSIYLAEARHLGIEVRPPHVNYSGAQFSLSWQENPAAAAEARLHPTLWMGLGQVRDLRRSSIQAILAARRDRAYTSVGDLLSRVALARKEWTHLIQCGALDGLGESRAALLAEASATQAGGNRGQLAFMFVAQAVAAEDASQRIQWETKLLGHPVSLHPLATVDPARLPAMKLHEVYKQPGSIVTVAGTRLPGWTGGKGWYCGDNESYVVAIPAKGMTNPRPWRPILLRGRWCSDGWGDGWIQVDEWHLLE